MRQIKGKRINIRKYTLHEFYFTLYFQKRKELTKAVAHLTSVNPTQNAVKKCKPGSKISPAINTFLRA